jgi:DNA-directed RNA polymerase alpha subunit
MTMYGPWQKMGKNGNRRYRNMLKWLIMAQGVEKVLLLVRELHAEMNTRVVIAARGNHRHPDDKLIADLELPVRAQNVLRHEGIITCGDLYAVSPDQWGSWPGLGPKTTREMFMEMYLDG